MQKVWRGRAGARSHGHGISPAQGRAAARRWMDRAGFPPRSVADLRTAKTRAVF